MRILLRRGVVPCLLLLAGCAAPGRPPAELDPEARLSVLAARVADHPDDVDARALLGLAYFERERWSEAKEHLPSAHAAAPERFDVGMALAELHRRDDDPATAVSVLAAVRPGSEEEANDLALARERMDHAALQMRMRSLAADERAMESTRIEPGTLGVLDFAPPEGSAELATLGTAMSAVLTTELARLGSIRLLERKRLSVLREELSLASAPRTVAEAHPDLAPANTTLGVQQRLALLSPAPGEPPYYTGPLDGAAGPGTRSAVLEFQRAAGLAPDGVAGPRTAAAIAAALERRVEQGTVVAADTAPRAGRLLGAESLLGGMFLVSGTDRLEARAQLVAVADGTVGAEFTAGAPVTEFYRLPGEITVRTAEVLGIALSESERRRLLDQPPPTRDLAAFLAFGRAVDLEDHGRFDEATDAYRQALALDPQFRLAAERVEVLSADGEAFRQSIRRAATQAVQAAVAVAAAANSGREAADRAMGEVGTGLAPDSVRDDSAAGGTDRAPQAEGPPTGTVRVRGQIPVGGGSNR